MSHESPRKADGQQERGVGGFVGLPRWLILQLLIMFAILASNVHWQWAPNSIVAGLIGFGVAYSVPWVLGKVLDSGHRHKRNK
jgi:hypothetical protein